MRSGSARLEVLSMALPALAFMTGCAGYAPGQKTYWDNRVRELCQKDGGVTVFERVRMTRDEYGRLGGSGGLIPIPHKSSRGSSLPYVADVTIHRINAGNPEVYRRQTNLVRTSDGKVLATQVTYGRIGGDFPTLGHPSSFGCRDIGIALDVERQVFVVER